jgi:hypothetical protein
MKIQARGPSEIGTDQIWAILTEVLMVFFSLSRQISG